MSSDPADDLLCATHRALCRHGYADLTMQQIADESTKSKAALHYHYDTKAELLLAFLDHLYESYAERLVGVDEDDPVAELFGLLDVALSPPHREDEAFQTAIMEIKAQSPYNEAFRDRLTRFDDLLGDRLRAAVADGVEDGSLQEADPDETATLLLTLVNGSYTRHVGVGAPVEESAALVREYVERHLVDEVSA